MTDKPEIVQGELVTDDDRAWIRLGRELQFDSPKNLDEAAKSYITISSSLVAIYTGSLALLKFFGKITSLCTELVLIIPIMIWLICISYNSYVYFPKKYDFSNNSPSQIEEKLREVCETKYSRLKIGAILFVLAIASSAFSIIFLSL